MTEVVCFPDDVQPSAVVISGSQVLSNVGDLRRYLSSAANCAGL